jgi:2-methylcitrate dehydratase
MQDRTLDLFSKYATTIHPLLPDTIHEVKRRIIDTFGVMYAALGNDSPEVARAFAEMSALPTGARIFGSHSRAAPDVAGFANGVHARYLDFNDTYLSLEPLHPSDVIPPLLALAESRHLSGRDLIGAIAIAYEVGVSLCDAASLRAHKWDHVNYIAIMVAAGAAHLLKLNTERAGHAISLAVVPHAAMRQTRSGELSMWKGVAAANSSRNALVAALLSEKGMTGPFQPFEGEMGFCELLTHAPLSPDRMDTLVKGAPPHRILDTYIKKYPVEYHAISAVDAALELVHEMNGGEIESVHIDTFKAAFDIIARDPEKWHPKTRETADHSLQYITLVTLEDGALTPRSFDPERIRSPRTQEFLANNVTLEEKPELTAGYPEGIPNTISVTLKDGRRLSKTVRYPRGHARNPMTDGQVLDKFNANVAGRLAPEHASKLCEAVWALDECAEVTTMTENLVIDESMRRTR